MSVKLATFNVNGINGRLDILLRWLDEARPDVVCLQELKAPSNKFPRKELERAGYGAIWHGQKSWNGVAILARGQEPLETRRGLPGDPDYDQSRYIEAVIDGMVVGCLYLPNGNPVPGPKFQYKLDWFRRLHSYAEELLELEVPVALVGDFNVMPTDLDVYKPERWVDDALFRPEVKAAYANLVAQGWTDALRHIHPNDPLYTFWAYFRNAFARDAGLRIDHFLLSPDLVEKLVKAEVDKHVRSWEHTSDHAPVWIELDRENPQTKERKMTDNWKREVRSKLEELVDGLVVNGVSYEDACSVIVVEVNGMLVAHEHDPDPADDDVIEEPANDWPAAEGKRPVD